MKSQPRLEAEEDPGLRAWLSFQDEGWASPSFILNGVNPSLSRHEPLFQELSVPRPSPKEAKGLWAAAIFLHPPPTYRNLPGLGLPPRAFTLGSHHRLGEGQGSYTSYGCPGEFPEGWGDRMSQVGKREGFLQALTSASLPLAEAREE